MAQQVWNFQDQFGNEHSFGIYHSPISGHFVSYLDNNILNIDFKVLDNKEYRFYMNHELMKFSITKINANEFIYSLVADIETPTPYNISLKKTSTENYRMILIGIIALIIIIIIFFILIKK